MTDQGRSTTAGAGSQPRPRTATTRDAFLRERPAPLDSEIVPLETFQPERQPRKSTVEDVYSSEEDDDVFAFERPITAAPKVVINTEGDESPQQQEAIPAQNDTTGPAPMHSRNPSNLFIKPSLISTSSCFATTEDEFTTGNSMTDASTASFAKKTYKQGRLLRQLLQKEKLDVIPGSREGSRGLAARAGESTVPDGRMTRGDGLGNMIRQWNSEQGAEREHFEEGEVEDSPYEEVRASVSNIDDPEMPSESPPVCRGCTNSDRSSALTWRVWVLGLLFLVLRSGLETVFQFRSPSASFPLLSIQYVARSSCIGAITHSTHSGCWLIRSANYWHGLCPSSVSRYPTCWAALFWISILDHST